MAPPLDLAGLALRILLVAAAGLLEHLSVMWNGMAVDALLFLYF